MIPGSKEDHASFVKSFGFALQGFRLTVRSERNIKVMLAGAVFAIVMGFVCGIDAAGWGVILMGCGIVLCAELFNTAIETIVDLVSPEYHPLAGRAKDVAAAAVWVLCIFVALAGIVVYIGALVG